jgi:hypothetical protein
VFVLDWRGDLPGRHLEVRWSVVAGGRFESRRPGAGMDRDVERTREVLAANAVT